MFPCFKKSIVLHVALPQASGSGLNLKKTARLHTWSHRRSYKTQEWSNEDNGQLALSDPTSVHDDLGGSSGQTGRWRLHLLKGGKCQRFRKEINKKNLRTTVTFKRNCPCLLYYFSCNEEDENFYHNIFCFSITGNFQQKKKKKNFMSVMFVFKHHQRISFH